MIIGIVGCGGIARAHVNALCLNPLVTGLALYDVNPDNVRQLSEISSLPVTNCQDLEQLAGVSQGFIICTPNHLHVSVAEEVLRYKQLPFVCENPSQQISTLHDIYRRLLQKVVSCLLTTDITPSST